MTEDQRKKSRRAIVDSEEMNQSEQPATDISDRVVEESIQLPRKKTRTSAIPDNNKKKNAKSTEDDLEKYAYDIINQMKGYYREDLDLNQQNRPSFVKIENIEKICSKIVKKEAQEVCLKMGILNELKTWLEPLPDNSLPNPKIKKTVLDLLLNLRVRKDDLLCSGIGKIVHFYCKNSREALDVRKLANKVVKKWKARIIREEIEE